MEPERALTPVELHDDSFTFKSHFQYVNVSKAVQKIVFVGTVNSELSALNVRWRILESLSLVHAQALLLDFRKLINAGGQQFDWTAIEQMVMNGFVRVLPPCDGIAFNATRHMICHEVEDAYSQIAQHMRQLLKRNETLSDDELVQNWQDLSLDISEIASEGFAWATTAAKIGVLKFTGVYQHGSAGSNDGRFVGWRIDEFSELVEPDYLVVDCRNLAYEWGDDFYIHPSGHHPRKTLLVVSEDNYGAFRGLFSEDTLRLELDDALKELAAL